MAPEIFLDQFEDDSADDRGDHLPTCRRIVDQILFDQARGISAERAVTWECSPMCTVPGEELER